MKIYLAGKWEESNKIRKYSKKLKKLGHEITVPWFDFEVGEGIDKRSAAMNDVDGVRMADCCIFIFENLLNYRGAYSELGMAIALSKRIIIVGDAGDRNVFVHYPLVEKVTHWEKLLKLLSGHNRA